MHVCGFADLYFGMTIELPQNIIYLFDWYFLFFIQLIKSKFWKKYHEMNDDLNRIKVEREDFFFGYGGREFIRFHVYHNVMMDDKLIETDT